MVEKTKMEILIPTALAEEMEEHEGEANWTEVCRIALHMKLHEFVMARATQTFEIREEIINTKTEKIELLYSERIIGATHMIPHNIVRLVIAKEIDE